MSFRTKLFLIFLITVLASVSIVAYGVTHYAQAAFEEMDTERTEALVSQFKKEYAQHGEEVCIKLKTSQTRKLQYVWHLISQSPNADPSIYVHDANGAAQDHGSIHGIVNYDGTLISSRSIPLGWDTKMIGLRPIRIGMILNLF